MTGNPATDLDRWTEEARASILAWRRPGEDRIGHILDIDVEPGGRHAVMAGEIMKTADAAPASRLARVDLHGGGVELLAPDDGAARLPRHAPDGRWLAYVRDAQPGRKSRLHIADCRTAEPVDSIEVDGSVEYLQWDGRGRTLLLGIADPEAERSSIEGATRASGSEDRQAWAPEVIEGRAKGGRRQACLYSVGERTLTPLDFGGRNVWNEVWCGDGSVAAITSERSDEGSWYHADLRLIDLATGTTSCLLQPDVQLGHLSATRQGQRVAIVEALASDRGVVCGRLRLIDLMTGVQHVLEPDGIDVAQAMWIDDQSLLIAGYRGLGSVIGQLDAASGRFEARWSSFSNSFAEAANPVALVPGTADLVFPVETFDRPPRLAQIRGGRFSWVGGFSSEAAIAGLHVERRAWNAPDGMEIEGWLLRRSLSAPGPLICWIHGGPAAHWRPLWLGRRGAWAQMLLERGCAIFLPNPRGSLGRGRAFASAVLGDPGGADAADILSGLDHLIETGCADPDRLAVIGGSYGGYMSAWLTTRSRRFAGAVCVAPSTNRVSQRLTSSIPEFVDLYMRDDFRNAAGAYFTRSPIFHAARSVTPTLIICGGRDRCTPPGEALQFHNALAEQGVRSTLVTYPEEGHGIRGVPAIFDFNARVARWLWDLLGAAPAETGRR